MKTRQAKVESKELLQGGTWVRELVSAGWTFSSPSLPPNSGGFVKLIARSSAESSRFIRLFKRESRVRKERVTSE